jgi:hypothetical protein
VLGQSGGSRPRLHRDADARHTDSNSLSHDDFDVLALSDADPHADENSDPHDHHSDSDGHAHSGHHASDNPDHPYADDSDAKPQPQPHAGADRTTAQPDTDPYSADFADNHADAVSDAHADDPTAPAFKYSDPDVLHALHADVYADAHADAGLQDQWPRDVHGRERDEGDRRYGLLGLSGDGRQR